MSAPVGHDASVSEDNVTISLSSDEALVLFDLLHRWEDEERVDAPLHEAEQIALWNLSVLLERQLSEPFQPGYTNLVSEARDRLMPEE